MVDNGKQKHRARDAYVSVVGFLSEDAQAELYRCLPYLEECVDNEVAAFGKRLKADLLRRASDESDALSKRLDELAEEATNAVRLANESGSLPRDVSGEIGSVVKTAEAFEVEVIENTALLRRVETLGQRVAEVRERRTTDGLRWALEDLKDSHSRWCAAVRGHEGMVGSPLAEALDKVAGKFEELEGILVRAHDAARAGDEGTQEACGEDVIEGDDTERDASPAGSADESMGTVARVDGPTGTADRDVGESGSEMALDDCVRALTALVWRLANDVQEAEARRVGELVKSVTELRQQAARLSKWDDAADRLRQSAERAKKLATDAKSGFNAAVANGIKAAHLDLLGGSDLGPERTQKRRGWRFWRRT